MTVWQHVRHEMWADGSAECRLCGTGATAPVHAPMGATWVDDDPPDGGVREPRRPVSDDGAGSIALSTPALE